MRALSEPQLSPDGRQVLVRITDATADGARSHLWLVDIALNSARQLTRSPDGDLVGEHNGRWMPDGVSILFLAKRGEHTQLFRLPMAGGDARAYDLKIAPVVDASNEQDALPPKPTLPPSSGPEALAVDVSDFAISPDGHTVAITARDPQTPGEKSQHDAKADALHVDHDLHGSRLYWLDPDSEKLTAVAVPPDVGAMEWSKQSDRLVAVANGPNHAEDLGPTSRTWMVVVGDPSHPSLLQQLPPTIAGVTWAADGKGLYYLAQSALESPPAYPDLYAFNLATGSIENLSPGVAVSLSGQGPVTIGTDIIKAVQNGTRETFWRFHNGKHEPLRFDSVVVRQLHCNAKATGCVWLGTGSTQPNTLYYAEKPGGPAKVLRTPNLLPDGWPGISVHPLHWRSDELTVEGLLYLPKQPVGAKIPLIVDVHGGPTGVWTEAFDPLVDYLVAQGWAVLRPNPRGSVGYGAAFAAANRNDMGGGDYRDIMAGVDAVMGQYPIDAGRLALVGYSYGGEMAGFAEGKTDRFKAIVSGAPVIDQQSEYGTEELSFYDRWFYGKPWEHPEDAWRQSPLAGVAHAKTPFLLLQGENDHADPLGQSQEMYRALRQAGVTVEMIQYPREDHGPLSRGISGQPSPEPWHAFDARRRMVEFIRAAFDKSAPVE